MDRVNFRKVADFLLNVNPEDIDIEAIYRSCSGRYYYELFHAVKSLLSEKYPKEFNSAGGGTHEALRTCCTLVADKLNDSEFEKLELKLRTIHNIRVKADYFLDRKFTKGDLVTAQVESERAILLIEALLGKYFPQKTA
ncbi:hypothetical protein F975_01890 [Acinetobacter sp. ANC 3789]|uniref:hypothetical protein n=1 Tax=Acinetobacter sp. ANC 3789 TaxID=1217714 RepID=UPI0002CDC538|nr:hypothetical protein [Acinetobacter sp. ANC 3789]ENU80137.1 hypothetical protein F975_01890 [Acinetobacter sp. ANC 3789]